MKNTITKWIWQHPKYPNFKFENKQLSSILKEIEYNRGILNGISQIFNKDELKNIQIETLTNEAINTSLIEGEVLKRDSVRASLLKKLDKDFNISKDKSTHQTDNFVALLLDCSLNKEPITKDRLFGWHNCIFESRFNQLNKIRIADFRIDDDMEVVSGAIGHEKIHYIAPPVKLINKDIENFLIWCNARDEDIYIKSAIAHLWFVIIHPFDDGNGRIARATADYLLSKDSEPFEFKLYSISTAINSDIRSYYDILDKTTNLFLNKDFDITPWLIWHLNILNSAMKQSRENIEYIVKKTIFWDKYRDNNLNERQVKILNKILDIGSDNFEGGISTKKYMAITKASKATAVRDIRELLKYGCIKQVENTQGRNIRYYVD